MHFLLTGEAHAAVNYLEELDNIMSVKGSFTETSPLVGALPLNTKMLRSSSQANVDSDTDTANLAQQNFPKPRNKACQSNEGTQNTDGMTKDKRENTKKVIRCKYLFVKKLHFYCCLFRAIRWVLNFGQHRGRFETTYHH